MSQFFKFVNRETKVVNELHVSNKGDYTINIHIINFIEAIEIFQYVAKINEWNIFDIIAVGDYGNLVWIENCPDAYVYYGTYCNDEHSEEYNVLYSSVWED